MAQEVRRLYRSPRNRFLAGVLGGLGEYLAIDPNIVRLLFVLFLIYNPILMLILYLAAALLLPEAPAGYQPPPTPSLGFVGAKQIMLLLAGVVFALIGWILFSAALAYTLSRLLPIRMVGLGVELTGFGLLFLAGVFLILGFILLYLWAQGLRRS